jgi:hypothetical protein
VAFSLYIAPFPGTSCHFPEIAGTFPVFEERGRLARCSRRPADCFPLASNPNVVIFCMRLMVRAVKEAAAQI